MNEQKLVKRKRKAVAENNEALLLTCSTELASLFMEEGRYKSAIEEFTTISRIYQKQDKLLEHAIANRGIGEAYLGLQNFDKALRHQQIYLEVARKLKNKLEEQRALATIGHLYLTKHMSDPDNEDKTTLNLAYKFFMRSLVICESLSGEVSKLEKADMSARLFSNLGLVQEFLGNYDKALELINKSINLCRVHDIFEQLLRGYMSLASLLEKKEDRKAALHQYNLAVETAKKIRDKPDMMAAALSSKADVLLKLGDIQGAKSTLLKAYKLKIPNVEEHKCIERSLRVVAVMSSNEEKLLSAKESNHKELKALYEKMGDGACELKCYDKAIDYYTKMLAEAKMAGVSNAELGSCYFSLAETFKDLGDFDNAVRYFEMELELCKDQLINSLNTLSKMADTKEAANFRVNEVQAVYDEAIASCRKAGNQHEEARMLKRCIAYLRRQKEEERAVKLEKEFAKLDYVSSDEESENSEAQSLVNAADEVDLENLTDISDDSDNEREVKSRRRTKHFGIKRNIKGETQLHTACINGKMNVVRHLLDQGHPVNVRDHCGWLPLHEACICGHAEIVRLLLENGAAINDRGGTHCGGVTPLHDAASNGHLEIVQLLLDKGANAVAKTDDGDTVLQFLRHWRSTVELDSSTNAVYKSLIQRLSSTLDKAGQKSVHPMETFPEPGPTTSSVLATCLANKGNLRRATDVDLDDYSATSGSATDEYRNVMDNLRNQGAEKVPRSRSFDAAKENARKPALITVEDHIVDDWLEDDVGQVAKRRKTQTFPIVKNSSKENLPVTNRPMGGQKSKWPSPKKSEPKRPSLEQIDSPSSVSSRSNYVPPPHLFDSDNSQSPPGSTLSGIRESPRRTPTETFFDIDDFDLSEAVTEVATQSNSSSTSSLRHRRKQQTKLTNFNYQRTFVEQEFTPRPSTRSPVKSPHTPFGTRRSSESIGQPVMEPTVSVDVRVNGKLFRIPVLLAQVNTLTIKWLAQEAASRYARKEFMNPTLELQTRNGAILADEDPISTLFPMGTSQSEEVEATVIKWDIPPLIDRFKDACRDMSTEPNDRLCKIIQDFSMGLDLSKKSFKGSALAPLCRALNKQTDLLELDLSRNFLTQDCVGFLATSICSLLNLQKLCLSCTGLTTDHIRILANGLAGDQNQYRVDYLDLSNNFIDDHGVEYLAIFTRKFKLKYLNIASNKFTDNCFGVSSNRDVVLRLENLESCDISVNNFSNDDVAKLMSWLNPSVLVSLDISQNTGTGQHLLAEVLCAFVNNLDGCIKLKRARLSRCNLQDSELLDLLRATDQLENLDLSYNSGLTGIALNKLLETETISSVDLCGCTNVLKYLDESLEYYSQRPKFTSLKVSTDPEQLGKAREQLIKLWRCWHGDGARIEAMHNYLCLTVM